MSILQGLQDNKSSIIQFHKNLQIHDKQKDNKNKINTYYVYTTAI